jgi:hypothetical protein
MENVSIEDMVDSYKKAENAIEELESEKKVIRDAILDQLKKLNLDGIKTKNGYNVRRVFTTLYNDVMLSTARELGATKTEEKVDSDKLRALEHKGVKIKGSKTTIRLMIKEAE